MIEWGKLGKFFLSILIFISLLAFGSGSALAVVHFTEDFEGDTSEWVFDSSWSVSEEVKHDGIYSLSDSPATVYSDNLDASATTEVSLIGAVYPYITFQQRHNLQSYVDFGYLEVSSDNGSNWTELFFTTSFSGTNWEEVKIDLSPYTNQIIKLRFRLKTDSSLTYDGWYIDDILIEDNTATLSYPLHDNFESGTGNWFTSSWGQSSPGYISTYCLNDSPGTGGWTPSDQPYGVSWRMNNSLTLAGEIDLSTAVNPQLTFRHRYYMCSCNSGGGHVQISANGGLDWRDLGSYYSSYWSMTDWQKIQLDLSAYIGLRVLIRFNREKQCGCTGHDGWFIDDVAISEACDNLILHQPANLTGHSMDLTWSKSTCPDFVQYDLYRSTSSGVNQSSEHVATISNQDTITYTDLNLPVAGQTYYYRIYVLDAEGMYNQGSNEVNGKLVFYPVPYYAPFVEDFETDNSHWCMDLPWSRYNDPASHSGSFNWVSNSDSIYENNWDKSLYTRIYLTGTTRPHLTFQHRHNLQSYVDFGYVEVSRDNGSSWSELFFTTGFSGTAWEKVDIDLSPYTDQLIWLRFRLKTDSSLTYEGWHIDDLAIENNTVAFSYPFYDDFESGNAKWLTSSWGESSPGHSSLYYLNDSPGTGGWTPSDQPYTYSYYWRMNNSLTLAGEIDLSTAINPQLTFWQRYNMCSCNGGGGYVQISANGGRDWVDLVYYYNYWSMTDWHMIRIDLSSYIGLKILIRFNRVKQCGCTTHDGWSIDDVAIHDACENVILYPPANPAGHSLDLTWTKSTCTDFVQYDLYRSTGSGVNQSSEHVTTISDRETTTYTDKDLPVAGQTYYYRIYVLNAENMYNGGSNEVSGKLLLEPAPYYAPFYEDFEAENTHWCMDLPWSRYNYPGGYGDSFSWASNPDGIYDNNWDKSLYTRIYLTGTTRPHLTFHHRHNLQSYVDFGYVEVSRDNGSSWTELFFTTGFSGTEWETVNIDLSPYTDQLIWLRFRLKTDSSLTYEGWHIDNLAVGDNTATLSYPFYNDFESGKDNWLSSSWGENTPGRSSIYAMNDSPGTGGWTPSDQPYTYSYYWRMNNSLTLAGEIDLSEAVTPQLIFWQHYNMCSCNGGGGYVQISANSGRDWVDLGYYYNYWSMTDWHMIKIDLSNYVGLKILIRFNRVKQCGCTTHDGWSIDDVYIGPPGTGSLMVDSAKLDNPSVLNVNAGHETQAVYGLVFEPMVTKAVGQGAGIMAQLGYGKNGSDPTMADWSWVNAVYDKDAGDYDQYKAYLNINKGGSYDYAYRFSLDKGRNWIYADLNGNNTGSGGSNGYEISQSGSLIVTEVVRVGVNPDLGNYLVGTPIQFTLAGFDDDYTSSGQKKTYLGTDFNEGTLRGVELGADKDRLQLSERLVTLPFIWVPNSNEGTVSKVDTETGQELGRYRVAPTDKGLPGNGDPSRTTVDLQGNCWVGNRQAGTVVKIGLFENGQYIDRNGNGIIETSSDTNGDGDITGSEILAWGEDECVLYEVVLISGTEGSFAPGDYTGSYDTNYWGTAPRGLAVDAYNNLWAGTYGSKKFYYIDGSTGAILQKVDVSPWNHSSYGAVMDRYGVLWSAYNGPQILRIDPRTKPVSISALTMPHNVYGIGLDYLDHLFSSCNDYQLSRIDVLTAAIEWTQYKPESPGAKGVVSTYDNNIWVAISGGNLVNRYDNDGYLLASIPVGSTPTGVSIDAEGKVWVCDNGDEYIHRIDPATNAVDLSKKIVGGTHYTYSDMTGNLARTVTTKIGNWIVVHDSGTDDTIWGTISWNSEEPEGTVIKVRVSSSNDNMTWSTWEASGNGVPLTSTPDGRYLKIETTLQVFSGDASPVLYDLTVSDASNSLMVSQMDGVVWSVKGNIGTIDQTGLFIPENLGLGSIKAIISDPAGYKDVSGIIDILGPAGGITQIEGGEVNNSDSTLPDDGDIYFIAYITARPKEVLTQFAPGCGFGSGRWQVNIGNFPTAWKAGESLHVEIIDIKRGEVSSLEYTITNAGQDKPVNLEPISYDLTANPDKTSVNTIVLVRDSECTTADDLLYKIDSENNFSSCATELAYFDAKTQSYVAHLKGSGLYNFEVKPGYPYFVTVTGSCTFTPYAFVPDPWPTYDLITTGSTDVNMMAMPLDRIRLTTAEEVATVVPDLYELSYWSTPDQAYITHRCGCSPACPQDFSVKPARVYFMTMLDNWRWRKSSGPAPAGGITQIESGFIYYSDGRIPEDDQISFKACLEDRDYDLLTEDSAGCGYHNGQWQINIGNFRVSWQAGEVLHICFVDAQTGESAYLDITLEYHGQSHDLTVASPFPAPPESSSGESDSMSGLYYLTGSVNSVGNLIIYYPFFYNPFYTPGLGNGMGGQASFTALPFEWWWFPGSNRINPFNIGNEGKAASAIYDKWLPPQLWFWLGLGFNRP